MGSYAIVGAHMPIAAGVGAQERGTGQVAVCFFGDGTTNIGAFHEALNMAVVWELPVVFVCENNLYMEYTPIGQVTAVEHPAADRAAAYGLESIVADGNDADEMRAVAQRTVGRPRRWALARRGEDVSPRRPFARRPREVPAGRRGRGMARARPDPGVPERLLADGVEADVLDEIEAEALAAVDRATEEAKAGPPPDPASLETELWSDGGSAWRN